MLLGTRPPPARRRRRGARRCLSDARTLAFGAGSDAAIDVAYALALVAAGRGAGGTGPHRGERAQPRHLPRPVPPRPGPGLRPRSSRRHGGGRSGHGRRDGDRRRHRRGARPRPRAGSRPRTVGRSTAGEAAAAEAFDLLERTDVRPVGWERLFALMAGDAHRLTAVSPATGGADRVEHPRHQRGRRRTWPRRDGASSPRTDVAHDLGPRAASARGAGRPRRRVPVHSSRVPSARRSTTR